MFFLDTDMLTHLHFGNSKLIDRIKREGENTVATTIVAAVEMLQGRHAFLLKAAGGKRLLLAQQLLDESEKLLLDTQIFPVNARAAAEFDQLRQVKKLKNIGRRDLLIACIALAHNAVLITRNIKHFNLVPQLRLEDW